jgi:hypothetical protein
LNVQLARIGHPRRGRGARYAGRARRLGFVAFAPTIIGIFVIALAALVVITTALVWATKIEPAFAHPLLPKLAHAFAILITHITAEETPTPPSTTATASSVATFLVVSADTGRLSAGHVDLQNDYADGQNKQDAAKYASDRSAGERGRFQFGCLVVAIDSLAPC